MAPCTARTVLTTIAILTIWSTAARQVAAQTTQPAGATPEARFRAGDTAIRQAINAGDYTGALGRILELRQTLAGYREELGADRYAMYRASLDVLARFAEARRLDQSAARRAAARREVIARQRVASGSSGVAPPSVRGTTRADGIPTAGRSGGGLIASAARHHATSGSEMPVVEYPDADAWRVIANRRAVGDAVLDEDRGYRKLAAVRDSVELAEDDDLAQAVNELRRTSGISIDVNWNELARVGVDRTTPCGGMRLQNVRLATVLQLLLDNVGSAAGVELGYTVMDGVVRISTAEDLNRHTLVRVYDVSDLLLQVRSFRAPADIFSDTGSTGGMTGGAGTFGGQTGAPINFNNSNQ